MTCVTGHLTNVDFTREYKNWSHPPPEALFNAPIVTSVYDVSCCATPVLLLLILPKDKKAIAQNLESQAKYAKLLIIWTDCDREGEHIGHEIVEAARIGRPDIQIKRAKFSNVERACVFF